MEIQGIIATSSQLKWAHDGSGVYSQQMVDKTDEIDEFKTNGGIWSLARSSVGLKLLVISGNYFNQVLSEVSRELVWLRGFEIGQRNLPSGISLKKLRVLELYERYGGEHHLEELWGETDTEAPVQLRQLLISHCHKFQGFPKSIGQLNNLKKIVIFSGNKVTSLPDEFCLLRSLEHLVLYWCKMEHLPSNFGDLRKLQHLSLWGCHELRRLPISFKNLMILEHLNLKECSKLTFTSEDLNCLENITKLNYLNLIWCEQLEELPRHITNQVFLRALYFEYTSLRELPDSIGQLSRLRQLSIEGVLLTSMPSSLGDLSSLKKLKIRMCDELEYIPDSLGGLTSLTRLHIEGCGKLEYLPDCLGNLSSLTQLKIFHCRKLKRQGVKSLPKSIRQLNNLQELLISGCPISELDFGAASLTFGLSNLKKIRLIETEVCRISFSEACCPHLETLHVIDNHHLEDIEAVPRTLQSIRLKNSEMLKDIPSFAGFTSLREFHLSGCNRIEKIEGLENRTSSQELTAETCLEGPDIQSLEHMQNLKWLQLRANEGSVIKHCIQTIQKWPDEKTIICARAVPDAASLVHSLLPPDLMILHSISNRNMKTALHLELESPSNGDAFMFLFLINCVSSQMKPQVLLNHLYSYSVKVEKGRWAWVGVFTQRSIPKTAEFLLLKQYHYEGRGEIEVGLVVRGEEQTTVQAFRNILRLLQS
ncbi:disease resistance protein RPV1-like [Cryptomeria japonica]|uniref:disease resistance protein RPV1-like n=1 Tax=Cryptomeria japonica TaxID=3369 RepID=UPI0027DA00F8|nr:disease resistance protein RPV1-like [Cryptomeria japonica]